jgi:hypothetical protein
MKMGINATKVTQELRCFVSKMNPLLLCLLMAPVLIGQAQEDMDYLLEVDKFVGDDKRLNREVEKVLSEVSF